LQCAQTHLLSSILLKPFLRIFTIDGGIRT
jgi:hypothetical protein